MNKLLLAALTVCWLLAGCDMGREAADTTVDGGGKAVGIAEKMKGGTAGDADLDSGESSSDGDE